MKGFIEAVQDQLNLRAAEEKAEARRKEVEELQRRQKKVRDEYLAQIAEGRREEIDEMKDRQALKMREIEKQQQEEKERYIRDHHEAQRLLAELEQDRRKEEELDHNDSLRDGPPPPKLGKT